MGIGNRRNAIIGWLVWEMAKAVAKSKARSAAPSFDRETKRPNRTAIVLAAAGVGLVAFVVFRKASGGDAEALG